MPINRSEPIYLSPLGFGCAPIMGKVAKAQAVRAMSMAFDLGVTHFDVARSYGFGRAESVVGRFLKGRRDKATLTTKFGVVPPTLRLITKAMIPVARSAAKIFPQLRKNLKNKSGKLLAERRYDLAYAKQCLDKSLSELMTDYIDIYLIHEPEIGVLANQDELSQFLEDSVVAGKIRRWGMAYRQTIDYQWAGKSSGDLIQFEGNIETLANCLPILSDTRQRVVTRPFGGGNFNSWQSIFSKKTVFKDIGVNMCDVSLLLARRLAGVNGSVVCSMFSLDHIQKNVCAMEKYSGDMRMQELIDQIIRDISANGSEE